MNTVATGVLRVEHRVPSGEGSFLYKVESVTNILVRFPFLPPVGLVVVFGGISYVVDGVHATVVPGPVAADHAAVASVSLSQETHLASDPRPAGPGVPVRLIDVERVKHDEGYEGDLVYFPALPRVGETFYDVRGEHNIRHAVESVSHVGFVRSGERRIEHQVEIRRDEGASVNPYRPLRPSRN